MLAAHPPLLEAPSLDVDRVRLDFPVLATEVYRKPPVFLDNTASSQKPVQVLDAMDRVYRSGYANVRRGVYAWSARCTELYDEARATIARFIGAVPEQVVFTHRCRAHHRAGARRRSARGSRRLPVGRASAHRRAGAGLRLPGLLRAQDARANWHWRAVRQARAA